MRFRNSFNWPLRDYCVIETTWLVQVVLYACKCIDYRAAGDLRNKILPANDFEPQMESLTTTNVRETIFYQLISLCEPVP